MLLIFLIISICYLLFLLLALVHWIAQDVFLKGPFKKTTVSIVVAARNEEAALPKLLDSFSKQSYPMELLEIIVVDDGSTDDTSKIATSYAEGCGCVVRVLKKEGHSSTPKKDALQLGIQQSRGEVLLFTDADCSMGALWVRRMLVPFSNPEVELVAGPIRYENLGFFEKLLSIEQAALWGSALTSYKLGIPSMCNGANLAIRKNTFIAVDGFSTQSPSASGDDELLLHKVFIRNPKAVVFLKDKEAIVETEPARDLRQLFLQRTRWAGKWEKYLMTRTKVFAFVVFAFHCAWIGFGILALARKEERMLFGYIFLLKMLLEFVFIQSVMKFLGKQIHLLGFVLLQWIYSPYVVFFGLLARRKKFEWKGRTLE